jgi:hypothetical protein
MEEHYRLMALESQQEDAEYRPSDDADADDDADTSGKRLIDRYFISGAYFSICSTSIY